MNHQLLYEIAGHRLLIETPDAKITEELIPSFRSFKVDNGGEDNLLFRFSGNSVVSVPNRDPDDVMEADGFSFQVYHTTGSVTVCVKKNDKEHRYTISADRKKVVSDVTLLKPYESYFLAYFLRAAYGMASVIHKTIKLHASVIEKDGKALLFMGKSGTGKSTHSHLWQEFVPGCSLLNDDEPIVRVLNNGSVRVYGAPWSGSTPCYRNAEAEVAAFVRLYQSPKNKLTKLSGVNAFAALYESVAILRSDIENRELTLSTVNDILEQVHVYRLDNRPDREAVSLTETLLI